MSYTINYLKHIQYIRHSQEILIAYVRLKIYFIYFLPQQC